MPETSTLPVALLSKRGKTGHAHDERLFIDTLHVLVELYFLLFKLLGYSSFTGRYQKDLFPYDLIYRSAK